MEDKLKKLFDYQRFEGNAELQKLIEETNARYPVELTDADLETISAAGENEIVPPSDFINQ